MAEDRNDKTRVARRDDWKTEPMPEQHETFVLKRTFSDAEMDALHCGHIPQAMDYRVDFKEDSNHVVMVNRDPEQYRCTRIKEDIASLNKLLDRWTRTPYDHYEAWLSETCDALQKAGKS